MSVFVLVDENAKQYNCEIDIANALDCINDKEDFRDAVVEFIRQGTNDSFDPTTLNAENLRTNEIFSELQSEDSLGEDDKEQLKEVVGRLDA